MSELRAAAPEPPAVAVNEVRILEGPNLYFTRPAVKVTLSAPGYLASETAPLKALAAGVGMRRSSPGAPRTDQRQRFTMRLVERAVRLLARGSGISRLGVRARAGRTVDDIVVAFVWRSRGRGQALGEVLEETLFAWLRGEDPAAAAQAGAQKVVSAPAGARPTVITPAIPVASVTGTNGKTTTTRMLAHIGMTAGLTTAWSSTDGVVAQGVMVEPGDYSGPAGARAVLATPGVQLGILETARGGMLLKGMGVTTNDVSVVTNVSADHLGLQGIDTLDQLAEVKAIVTRATKPDGWVILNGDDPRVWAMRVGIKGRPWAFSLDPNSPALREALDVGGRGMTILDDRIAVLESGKDPDRLVRILDVPATMSGLSRHNLANALAASAAALGLGLPREAVVDGLKTFLPDAHLNPGRMNTYTLPTQRGTVTVILDLAHNEAGLDALMDVAHGLKAPGAQVLLGLGLAGDRTDELLQQIGEMAGLRANRIVAAHKEHYLRGRTMEDLDRHLRIGLARAGIVDIDSYDTELGGLLALVDAASEGDVVALMCHAERREVTAWLADHGATADDPEDIRRKVIAARGEHELEEQIAELWAVDDAGARLDALARLAGERPEDPRLTYEHASALDASDATAAAIPLYRAALAAGLREPHRHLARIQLASSLRAEGQASEALELLDDVARERPTSAAVAAFRALALADVGRPRQAVSELIESLLAHAPEEDAQDYRRALTAYAKGLAEREASAAG